MAFLSKNDVCGDSQWRDSKFGKSVVHIRALTYCDIHTINVDDLKKVDSEEFISFIASLVGLGFLQTLLSNILKKSLPLL